MSSRIVTIVGYSIAVIGLVIVVTDLFVFVGSSAVLCTDPEEFRCSGHYVRGVPNLVLGLGAIVVGVLLVLLSHVRGRRTRN